jgi:hypothetical protein
MRTLAAIYGDDWAVVGTLLDIDGSQLDLTGATLGWVLAGPDGAVVASFPGAAEIAIWEPVTSGSVIVTLGSDITADSAPGRYTDALRVTTEHGRQTMWRGAVLVGSSPEPSPSIVPPSPPSPISIATAALAIGTPAFALLGVDQLG